MEIILFFSFHSVPQRTALNGFKFCCVHCQDESNSCESFESIIDLYAHWIEMHGTKPFQFYVNSMVACFHCETDGLYHNIITHMKENHPDEPRIIVNPKNRNYCSVCHYKGDDLKQHFEHMHDIILQTNVFNAVCLPDETLMDLLAFDVHKKYQCGYCDEVFESKSLIEEHQSILHGTKKVLFKEFSDDKSAYLICGYCKCQLRRSEYLSHVDLNHIYKFNCTKCDFETSKLIELIDHDKEVHHLNSLNFHCSEFSDLLKKHYFETRIVFGNGLVVNKYNLLGTKYDDSSRFVQFIESLIAEKKRQFDRSKCWNSSSTEHTEDIECDDLIELSSVVDSATSSPNTLYSELNKQNKIIKNVTIEGVKWRKDEDLYEIFEEICKRLGSSVRISDIESVYRMHNTSEIIIVEFKDLKIKERFIYRASRIFLWTSDLKRIPKPTRKKRIYINNEMTQFYQSLWNIVRKERKRGVIYSAKISKYGLEIKRTSNSKGRIILKRSELLRFLRNASRLHRRFGVNASPAKESD